MLQPSSSGKPAEPKKAGSWSSHVHHLRGMKQLSAWTPQSFIRRSTSRSRSGSPRPSPSPEPQAVTSANEESDQTAADSGEIKESLIHLLSGCYHEAAEQGRRKKSRRGQPLVRKNDSPDSSDNATQSSTASSLTTGTSEDEEEDNASDSELSLLSFEHTRHDYQDSLESSDEATTVSDSDGPTSSTATTNINKAGHRWLGQEDSPTTINSDGFLIVPDTLKALSEEPTSEEDKLEDATPNGIHTLAFVQEKAGVWPVREGEKDEVLIMSVPAVQCRAVMIKGTLYLTNKRLVFYAWLALDKEGDETTILQEGVLTFVYPQKWKGKRRVYCVLSPYGVASYTSATDRLHPRSARSLSAFKEVTMDPHNPLRFRVEELNGSYRWVYTDTKEHTRQWFDAMQAALFRYRCRSDYIVTSVPLARVDSFKFDDIMDFCKVMQFDISCATPETIHPEDEVRQVVWGVSRENWHILPKIEAFLEKNKLPDESRGALVPQQPEVVISFDTGEQRHEIDRLQSSSNNLAADFVRGFGLEDKPEDVYITSVDVLLPYPDYGHIAVSKDYLCFWRKSKIGEDTKARISMSTIDDVFPSKNYRLRVYSMTVQIHAEKDLKFEFHSMKSRDKCIEEIQRRLEEYQERHHTSNDSSSGSRSTPLLGVADTGRSLALPEASDRRSPVSSIGASTRSSIDTRSIPERQASTPDPKIRIPAHVLPCLGTIINLPSGGQPRIPPRHFVLMTIGSRGDVQPYIALGKRLMQEGHRVTIASHEEYKGWVVSHGMEYKCIGGSPTALMQLSIEHKMFSPGFFRETLGKFREWFDDLLRECWAACQEADVLIESPTAFAGIHVAEALGIPYFRAFTMPWTSTASYPQAFAPILEGGGAYNSLSYSIFDKVLWQASASQINRWRKHVLHIKPTTLEKLEQRQVPFLYNFSQAVVPPPLDWSSLIRITGYWFLDQPDANWVPQPALLDFMRLARSDNVPLVYVGFGSITIKDVEAVTEHIYEAALTADVRVILSRGWSARGKDGKERKIQLKNPPPNVYLVDSIPHDWLFPKIDAAMHRGGAGTTGASLRAGLPTIIKPFFGDQFFWSSRVQKLGVGIRLQSLASGDIAKAFTTATRNRIMQERAEDVGKRIRAEDGCGEAIKFVYGLLSTAERQAKERHNKSILHEDARLIDEEEEAMVKLATDKLNEVAIGYAPTNRASRDSGSATPLRALVSS